MSPRCWRRAPLALPAGRYPVGQSTLDFAAFGSGAGGIDRGPIRVRIWYPADPNSSSGPWRRRVSLLTRRLWGGGADDALPGRPPNGESSWPLIVYHAGWPGTHIDNFRLIGAMANHGYVVVAPLYDDATPMDYSSDAACRATVALANRRAGARARDTTQLIDRLLSEARSRRRAAAVPPIDGDRIGVVGFSFGGAIAAEAATLDQRVRAAVNIDGRHWGSALDHGVTCPYLYIGAPALTPPPDDPVWHDPGRRGDAELDRRDQAQLAVNLRRLGGIRVTIAGVGHLNFADCALRPRIRRSPYFGPLSPRRAHAIVHVHVTDFLEQALRHAGAPLRPPTRSFPEAQVEVWERPD